MISHYLNIHFVSITEYMNQENVKSIILSEISRKGKSLNTYALFDIYQYFFSNAIHR